MNKKILILIGIIVLIILAVGAFYIIKNHETSIYTPISIETTAKSTDGLTIVPTMQDAITSNSAWCGTFQLVWNDLKNESIKQDIIFTPQEQMATNLNKEEFKSSMISDDSYYKKYGVMTPALKTEIEQGIKDKFNQTSDILDSFDWSNADPNIYFFYTMLYKKFEFLQPFDILKKGKFGSYSNVEYFGIDKNTNDVIGDQIHVLYYNSQDDFAITIDTKTNDEVIFCKNPTGNTFHEIYYNMNIKASNYTGNKSFANTDEFKAPYLTFNELRDYTELEKKWFTTADGNHACIEKALQTIKFSLDEKGGEIKSEAGIVARYQGVAMPETPRYFYVDNTFAIFLREKGQSLPYFADKIDDITKFQ
ncbi:MAG: hypothetical protein FWF46_05740 [Oscillospiraceae bacterium]|nr:hypothetical protein [Oscillospiraceae bacterium]